MKFVYIDESFDEEYFVLTAVAVANKEDICERLDACHKLVKNSRLSREVKERLLRELKANLLYKHSETIRLYKKIIAILLNGNDDLKIIGVVNAVVGKHDKFMTYELYKKSLEQIIKSVDDKTTVFCDDYGDAKFQEYIKNNFNSDCVSVDFCNSCEIKPIQAADLFCSPIRKSITDTDVGVFQLIQRQVTVNR